MCIHFQRLPGRAASHALLYRDRVFDLEFDFCSDQLLVRTSDGDSRHVVLEPKPVADFYAERMDVLADLRIDVEIQGHLNEADAAIPFAEDHEHRSYDAEAVRLFWHQLIQANRDRAALEVDPSRWNHKR